jgi:hypothetical protein
MTEFDKEYKHAKKRVAELDAVDGFPDRHLGTILSALEAGLKHPKTGAHYDALVMLEDLVQAQPVRKAKLVALINAVKVYQNLKQTQVLSQADSRQHLAALQKQAKDIGHHICLHCGDTFDRPVWHCRHCDHHWLLDRDYCKNCHRNKPGRKRKAVAP